VTCLGLTLSQTNMRFQKPIMESCAGDRPLHACASLIATTCMTWISVSIVSSVIRNRTAYRAVALGSITFGRDS
jgi:hypothetical protein